MNSNTTSPAYNTDQLTSVKQQLSAKPWLISCLCAAWCDTCASYRSPFDQLQERHPDKCFAWVDIEDHADMISDLDIENFPTILIQFEDRVLFLGTTLPDANIVDRLIHNYQEQISQQRPITPSIQTTGYELPPLWSLRRLILENC
ncbi:MAG: thioredoxin family protein [Burkholderiales bacterium]|nr:thioredoxin family protein [Burkholderiales bacterium]